MATPVSPQLGYNTNVRHRGKLFHVQTEDSGVNHPHIMTHLFADGGRIIASRKTSYAEHLGTEDLGKLVKRLMQEQHKAMLIDLRNGAYDSDIGGEANTGEPLRVRPEGEPSGVRVSQGSPVPSTLEARVSGRPSEPDDAALERAAALKLSQVGRMYQTTKVPVAIQELVPKSLRTDPAQVAKWVNEKSFDELVLAFVAEDLAARDK